MTTSPMCDITNKLEQPNYSAILISQHLKTLSETELLELHGEICDQNDVTDLIFTRPEFALLAYFGDRDFAFYKQIADWCGVTLSKDGIYYIDKHGVLHESPSVLNCPVFKMEKVLSCETYCHLLGVEVEYFNMGDFRQLDLEDGEDIDIAQNYVDDYYLNALMIGFGEWVCLYKTK